MNTKLIAGIAAGIILITTIIAGRAIMVKNKPLEKEPIAKKDIVPEVSYNNLIKVSFPKEGERVGGTINVTGIARGSWYFEGDFPVELWDLSGKMLASAAALAEGEWMKEEFVPFSAALIYSVSEPTPARLVLKKNNPSDLPEQNAQIEIPVTLEPEKTSAKIFFMSQHNDPFLAGCNQVFPVARSVGETMAFSHQAVEELLAGPTEQEKALGYQTAIPSGVKIQQFDPFSKVARIDLSRELLELDVDVACRRIFIQTQLEKTIKNSSGAEKVIITVDGKSFR